MYNDSIKLKELHNKVIKVLSPYFFCLDYFLEKKKLGFRRIIFLINKKNKVKSISLKNGVILTFPRKIHIHIYLNTTIS